MDSKQPTGVSQSNFMPWPPDNKVKHVMEKENCLSIVFENNGPKEMAARAAKKAKQNADNKKGQNEEITH